MECAIVTKLVGITGMQHQYMIMSSAAILTKVPADLLLNSTHFVAIMHGNGANKQSMTLSQAFTDDPQEGG